MSLNCYFANFTSYIIETALSDSNGNPGQITRGSDFISGTVAAAGVQILPNTISASLAQIDNSGTRWDWMYFNLLSPNLSTPLKLQSYLQVGDSLPTIVDVGPYDPNTSNDNRMPQVYRTYGGGNATGIWFMLSDADLPTLSTPGDH